MASQLAQKPGVTDSPAENPSKDVSPSRVRRKNTIGKKKRYSSSMIRENPIVRVPSHVVLLGRVVGLLSGLGRSLEARIDMLQTILPYVLKAAQKG